MSDKQKNWKALEELAASADDAAKTIDDFFKSLREVKEQLDAERADFVKSMEGNGGDVPALQEDDFWFPATEPPKESGEVLICEIDKEGNVIYMIAVPYSKKYNAFNVRDRYEDTKTELHPDYWKPIPKRVEDLRIWTPKET